MRRALAICFGGAAAAMVLSGCRSTPQPHIQFAPPGTDVARLRSDFALIFCFECCYQLFHLIVAHRQCGNNFCFKYTFVLAL